MPNTTVLLTVSHAQTTLERFTLMLTHISKIVSNGQIYVHLRGLLSSSIV